jgi:hypothetical protein
MSDWQPEDELTTTFGTIKQAQAEWYQQGWEDAINYVIDISKDMKYNRAYWDTKTLDELEQRIV